jgi:hypothetical protein
MIEKGEDILEMTPEQLDKEGDFIRDKLREGKATPQDFIYFRSIQFWVSVLKQATIVYSGTEPEGDMDIKEPKTMDIKDLMKEFEAGYNKEDGE